MKRNVIAPLVFTMILLSACGNKEAAVVEQIEQETQAAAQISETENKQIAVEENLLSVEFTIPKDFFGEEGTTQEELDETAKEKGIDKITLNEDGSVTYKMSKSVHTKMMDDMKQGIEEACNDLVTGENAITSYKEITFNDDMTQFSIYVDKSEFSDFDTLSALGLYFSGSYYQLFNCVPNDDIDVQVDFIDRSTDEVISTKKLSDTKMKQ